MLTYKKTILGSLCMLVLPGHVDAKEDLFALEFEQLMEVQVVSIAKKAQSVRQTAAAVHVISQLDIQRSGATTLPEVLRGAPGVHVAHVDGNKWAISIRGFNDRFANKLLVLVDGRSVYTPIFSGVYWNMQDMPLATIERIEIVRGSGGTLWGANAVNGVINIITKHTEDTQGIELSFLGGSEELIANIMHGGKVSENVSYRVYAKAKKQDEYAHSQDGAPAANDNWTNAQAGFRLDSARGWLLEGAYIRGQAEGMVTDYDLAVPATLIVPDRNQYQAGHLLVRTQHPLANNSKLQVQAYYDYAERSSLEAKYKVHTFDLDAQHQFQWGERQSITWGLGYRGIQDELGANNIATLVPERRYSQIFSGFIQDEVQLSSVLRLTLGSKFSHNSYSGFEYQPSVRLLWEISPQHSLWSAVSRAVRTPVRTEEDVRLNASVLEPFVITLQGNPEYRSEELTSVEFGYRGAFLEGLSVDATVFYNHYNKLRSVSPQTFIPPNFIFDNRIDADSVGVEFFSKWQLRDNWQLSASYSFLYLDAHLKGGAVDPFFVVGLYENSDPKHQASVRSAWQLPFDLAFNAAIYYTGKIKQYNVDDFTRLDLGVVWKPNQHFELSLVGQNLLEAQHKEYASNIGGAFNTEVPRSVYAKVITRF